MNLSIFSLSNKKAIVTGGYSGIGKQIAEAFLEAGAKVAICARRPEKWTESYKQLEKTATEHANRLIGFRCDVSNKSQVDEFVNTALKAFGSIDVLVNAAGIAWSSPVEETKLENWEEVLRINLTGTFLCCQSVGKTMIKQSGGSIINVSSVLGLLGTDQDVLDAVSYSASKAGIIGLTRDLATKWAKHNVRVNALVPGWFRTHMTEYIVRTREDKLLRSIPMRRLGSDSDLKGAAIFLASQASGYVTGETICIDGGLTASR